MINKIHSNVKTMMSEAEGILRKQLTPSKLSEREGERSERIRFPSSFLNKKTRREREEQKSKIKRNDCYNLESKHFIKGGRMATQSDQSTLKELRRSLNHQKLKKELSTLMPDESELLSTRIYGFHKHSLRRSGDAEHLPPLKTKVNNNSMEKQDKFTRMHMFSVIDRRESEDFSTIDATEQVYLLNTLRKKIKLKISDRAISKSIKLPRKSQMAEQIGPQPWFLDQDDPFK